MKKISYDQFGGTEVLKMTEAPMPDKDIVVKVKAVSINPLDWKIWQGDMKLMSGRSFPKSVGIDFAGIVEKGGGKYRKGDEVLGFASIFKGGALAEYVSVKEDTITLKPRTISFEEAASIPVVGSAALQIMNDLIKIKTGMQVLINGAGGGVGPFAIQLAKRAGAIVTAAVGPNAIDMAIALGSDQVIDYRQQDILAIGRTFDAIVDLSGKLTYNTAKKILNPKAVFINTTPTPLEMLRSLFSGGRYKLLVLKPKTADLERLVAAKLQIFISQTYDWHQYRKAYDEARKGGLAGKAVLTIS